MKIVIKMKRKKSELLGILILVLLQVSATQFNSEVEVDGATNQNNIQLIQQEEFNPSDAEIFINSDDDFLSYAFPGNGTINDPFRIENYTFDTIKLFGILIVNTTKHVVVQNNSIAASNTALKVEFNDPGTLSFKNNTCKNSEIGLCTKFTAGIVIRYNDFWGNNESLLVINTRDVLIENNTVRNNNLGIVLKTTNATFPTVNCSVMFNLIENNTGYGVTIPAFYENRWTKENSIHHNTFANNNPDGKKQALDDGIGNEWDDGENTGNYWSDWWGIGSYNIRGLAKSKDNYPLNDPIHVVTTKIPGIFKGRILIFVVFTPILLGGYIFVQTRKRRSKTIEEE